MKQFTKITTIAIAVAISLSYVANAQVGINKDGSSPGSNSILHVKGDAVNKDVILEPGTNGNVGIGTTTPSANLDIRSSSPASASKLQLGNSDVSSTLYLYSGNETYNPYISFSGGDALRFAKYDGGFNELMRLDAAGNLSIGTENPEPSAALDVNSTNKGLLPPRMSSAQMNAISSPPAGLMVYNTTINSLCFYDGTEWNNTYNKSGRSCGTITYGGQTYQTVVIGIRCWMAENLNIGGMINGSSNQTNNGTIEKYCYQTDSDNCDIYGGLYQWDEMMGYVTTEGTQGICPTGWRLPTDDEWKAMEMFLGMSQAQADASGWRGTNEGGKMKETSTAHWYSPNTGATNSSGFTAFPGGDRYIDGTFMFLGSIGYWWASTEASATNMWMRSLAHNADQVYRGNFSKANGFSVRCIND